ncbi:hypothetical protein Barb6_00570 [Bacteroidales bacterium Barb6]|nr:hypothetical protein Barb6_00570 [Bacteroidales bacterium Barb6]
MILSAKLLLLLQSFGLLGNYAGTCLFNVSFCSVSFTILNIYSISLSLKIPYLWYFPHSCTPILLCCLILIKMKGYIHTGFGAGATFDGRGCKGITCRMYMCMNKKIRFC